MSAQATEWPRVPVSELGRTVTGRTPSTAKPFLFGDDYPFITPTDMDGARTIYTTARGISAQGANELRGKCVPKGSVAVSCIGWQLGKAALVGVDAFTNQQINTVVPNQRVIAQYLYYHLLTRRPEIRTLGSVGTRTPILNKSAFTRLEVPLPPLATQRKIAAVLSAYDDLIESNIRRIKLLEEIAQRIYREWFVDFRYPGHQAIPLVESDLGQIPQGWTWRSLFDVAAVTFGYPFKSDLFNTKGHGTPLIRIRDLQDNHSETFTTEVVAAEYEVIDGDLLIGMDGDFHMCKWASGRSYLNQRVCRFRPRPATLGLYGMFLALQKPISEWNQAIVGTTVAHLGKKHLELIQILTPPSEVAAAMVRFLDPTFELEIALRRELSLLRRCREILLPRLISGKIDVERLEIVVADVA